MVEMRRREDVMMIMIDHEHGSWHGEEEKF